jgi:hypothetical protein
MLDGGPRPIRCVDDQVAGDGSQRPPTEESDNQQYAMSSDGAQKTKGTLQ